jgi:osmotically-inducible protein OsmY
MKCCGRTTLLSLGILALGMPSLVQNLSSQSIDRSASSLAAIRQALADDPGLHDITVEISEGYVHLSGSVAVLEDARRTVRKVQESGRVTGVINQIRVNAPRIADTPLRLQLEEKGRDRGYRVRLRVRRGIVRLRGTIATEHEREDILTMICSTPGVRGVEDLMQLVVGSETHIQKALH